MSVSPKLAGRRHPRHEKEEDEATLSDSECILPVKRKPDTDATSSTPAAATKNQKKEKKPAPVNKKQQQKDKSASTTTSADAADAAATAPSDGDDKKKPTESAATRKRRERRKRNRAAFQAKQKAEELEKKNGGADKKNNEKDAAEKEQQDQDGDDNKNTTSSTTDDAAAPEKVVVVAVEEKACEILFLPKTEGERIIKEATEAFHRRREQRKVTVGSLAEGDAGEEEQQEANGEDAAASAKPKKQAKPEHAQQQQQQQQQQKPKTFVEVDEPLFGTRLTYLIYVGAACVPAGAVTTHTRLARYVGCPGQTKKVIDALSRNRFEPDEVAVHRVTTDDGVVRSAKKAKLLKKEGVKLDKDGKVAKEFLIV